MQVQERRLETLDPLPPYVEKTRAAWSAQKLAPGCRQHVAAEAFDVERHLPCALARVEEKGHVRAPGHRANRGGWVHQPAVGRDVRQRDQFHPLIDHASERGYVDLPGFVVGHDFDFRPGAPRDLEQRDRVARVFAHAGQDVIAWAEGHGVEGHVPAARRVLDQRDLVAMASEHRGDRVIDSFNFDIGLSCRLVAADFRFPPKMRDHGVEHRGRRQR